MYIVHILSPQRGRERKPCHVPTTQTHGKVNSGDTGQGLRSGVRRRNAEGKRAGAPEAGTVTGACSEAAPDAVRWG